MRKKNKAHSKQSFCKAYILGVKSNSPDILNHLSTFFRTLIIAYSWWIRGMVSVFKSLPITGKICWSPHFSFTSEISSLKMTLKDHGLHFFRSAVGAVLPGPMLKRSLAVEPGGCPRLLLLGRPFELKRNLYLVGFGKAVLGMAAVAEDILGGYLTRGIISIPQGIQEILRHAGMR